MAEGKKRLVNKVFFMTDLLCLIGIGRKVKFYLVFLTTMLVALSCKGRSQEKKSCTCDLSDLEILEQNRICWNRAGADLEGFWDTAGSNVDTLFGSTEIQERLDRLEKSGGGTLIVSSGNYEITEPIHVPSGVRILGVSRDSSVFEIKMTEEFEKSRHWMEPQGHSAAILFEEVENASLENLTLEYRAVDFEPVDFESYDHAWENRVFHEHNSQTENLFVSTVWFENAENCVLSRCNILRAGNDPVRIRNSRHITCSYNFIDRAYNKGGGGAGYYNLINSHYCLLYKETVKRIRHLSIHKRSSYNVVYGCDLQVDVNFHNGDLGHNLIENNQINIPVWHSWHCFGTGAPSMHLAPGPYNVLFNNKTDYKSRGPEVDSEKLYFMCDYFPDSSKGLDKFVETEYASFFSEGIFNSEKSYAIKN
jgi:hypothetical protein